MHGTIIVIEGLDGCGKSTQLELLKAQFTDCRFITFPNYESPSGHLITQYLQGEFHEEDPLRSAYSASSFYAADRYASFKTDWGEYYSKGGVILSDRYTTSNAVHQSVKCTPEERPAFLKWLDDFEHEKMGLPRPDMVIYLDVPTEATVQLLRSRESATNTTADIHEKDTAYLAACRECAGQAADILGWQRIRCLDGSGKLRSIEDIHEEIWGLVAPIL